MQATASPDNIHILVNINILPKYSVSNFVGYLKGKILLKIFERHASLKYKYRKRRFWSKGYYVDIIGRNDKAIKKYIVE